jgi:hypothetical protein
LETLPTSSAISILQGEGLVNEPKGELVNDGEEIGAFAGPFALQDSNNQSGGALAQKASPQSREKITLASYESRDVTRICKGLNHQNRMAKVCFIIPLFSSQAVGD